MRIEQVVRNVVAGVAFGAALMMIAPHLASAGTARIGGLAYSSSWTSGRTNARAAFDGNRRTKWCPRGNAVGAWVSVNLDKNVGVMSAAIQATVGMTIEMQIGGKKVGTFNSHGTNISASLSSETEGNNISFYIRAVRGRGTPCIKDITLTINNPNGLPNTVRVRLGRHSWGAFAVNRNTGRWVYRVQQTSKKLASKRALRACGAGCEVIVAFREKCAAIVRVGTKVYFGHGKNKSIAQKNAAKFCMKGIGSRSCGMTAGSACSKSL